MVTPPTVTQIVQLMLAVVGLCVSTYMLQAVCFDFRLLRRMGLNGIKERITLGDVIAEMLRVALHCTILVPTVGLIWQRRPYPLNFGGTFLIAITLIVTASSINSYLTRLACLNAAVEVAERRIERRKTKRPS